MSDASVSLAMYYLVRMGHSPQVATWQEVARKVLTHPGGFALRNLAPLAWAMSRAEYFDRAVFKHVVAALARGIDTCSAWEVGQIVHACARVRYAPPQEAMEKVLGVLPRLLVQFAPKHLSILAWAL